MRAPQIIWIVLAALNLLSAATSHGKPRTGKHNFWLILFGSAMAFALLWWGGFFV